MKKILVTGASGFIGQALCNKLIKLNLIVCATVRNPMPHSVSNDFECISVGNINLETNWKNALKKVDYIIHCAGIAHKMTSIKDLDYYNLLNFLLHHNHKLMVISKRLPLNLFLKKFPIMLFQLLI